MANTLEVWAKGDGVSASREGRGIKGNNNPGKVITCKYHAYLLIYRIFSRF